MYKHTIPALFPLIAPGLTWKVNTADKALYLTFDDGPHPEITPRVLSLLDQYNAKATFFCVGDNVKKYPDTFKAVIAAGHAVGNHTHNHLKGWITGNDAYFKNIEMAAEYIPSRLFRPPYGRITPSQIARLKQDYTIVMWSMLTRDYDKKLNCEKAAKSILRHTRSGDIVVFHDSEKAADNMFYLLEKMLRHFGSLQYSFKSL